MLEQHPEGIVAVLEKTSNSSVQHVVVIVGKDSDGNYMVYDPGTSVESVGVGGIIPKSNLTSFRLNGTYYYIEKIVSFSRNEG